MVSTAVFELFLLGSDLVSVSPPRLLGQIEATVVSREAAVRPVGVVKAERPPTLTVTWVLNGDGVCYHGVFYQ